jgi:hypothetical protein
MNSLGKKTEGNREAEGIKRKEAKDCNCKGQD